MRNGYLVRIHRETILHILVPLVETLPFCTLANPHSSIDVAWIYTVGKGLLAATGSPACYSAYRINSVASDFQWRVIYCELDQISIGFSLI